MPPADNQQPQPGQQFTPKQPMSDNPDSQPAETPVVPVDGPQEVNFQTEAPAPEAPVEVPTESEFNEPQPEAAPQAVRFEQPTETPAEPVAEETPVVDAPAPEAPAVEEAAVAEAPAPEAPVEMPAQEPEVAPEVSQEVPVEAPAEAVAPVPEEAMPQTMTPEAPVDPVSQSPSDVSSPVAGMDVAPAAAAVVPQTVPVDPAQASQPITQPAPKKSLVKKLLKIVGIMLLVLLVLSTIGFVVLNLLAKPEYEKTRQVTLEGLKGAGSNMTVDLPEEFVEESKTTGEIIFQDLTVNAEPEGTVQALISLNVVDLGFGELNDESLEKVNDALIDQLNNNDGELITIEDATNVKITKSEHQKDKKLVRVEAEGETKVGEETKKVLLIEHYIPSKSGYGYVVSVRILEEVYTENKEDVEKIFTTVKVDQ